MSLLQGSFTKETNNLIDPTNQSHPIQGKGEGGQERICVYVCMRVESVCVCVCTSVCECVGK